MLDKKITLQSLFFGNIFISFAILLTFFKPAFIYENESLNELVNMLCIIISFISLILYFWYKKTDKLVLAVMLFFFTLFFSTIINNKSIVYFMKIYVPLIGCILYLNMMQKYSINKFVRNLSVFLYSMIILNFISVLLGNTNEFERMYFLGYDNSFAPFISISSIILAYFSLWKYGKLKSKYWFINIITIVSCFMITSSNATFIAFLLIIFDMFMIFKLYNKKFVAKNLNLKNYLIFSLVIFILIVLLRFQDFFSYIIIDVLNRDLTFTGRTFIWDRTIEFIKQNLIVGYGVEDFELRTFTKGIFHAHSNYLNILLEGGIISFMVYLNIFRVIWDKIKNNISKISIIVLSFGVLIFFVMSTIEYYSRNYILYILLFILYYEDVIWKGRKKNE